MASTQSLVRKGKNCLVIVQDSLEDIHKGRCKDAVKKLQELKEDSIILTEEAEKLAKRLEKVEAYYISKGESILQKIGELGCQEDALKAEQTSEERKLASHQSVLQDNEKKLSSAERDLEEAKRKLEQAKKEEASKVAIGITTGAVVGGILGPVGVIIGGSIGAGVAQTINAINQEVARAEEQVSHRENDQHLALTAVRQSESRISSIQSEIRSLEARIEGLKENRLEYHKNAAQIKEAIIFLKKSVEFWQLFKQASEHGTNRTSVLEKIVEIANKKEGIQTLKWLCSTGTQRVEKTFLDAWEDMEMMALDAGSSHIFQIEFGCTFCKETHCELPHVIKGDQLCCDECVKCAIEY